MTEAIYIKSGKDVQKHVQFITEEQESFVVMLLNNENKLLDQKTAFLGTVNQCPVHAREIFKESIRHNASAIVLVHNHPSGDPTPSEEDKTVTEHLFRIGEFIGIEVLDHVIIGDGKYYSFAESGAMPEIK